MSTVRKFKVICDVPDCVSQTPSFSIGSTARNVAQHHGFHLNGSIAICGSCWEKGIRYDNLELKNRILQAG